MVVYLNKLHMLFLNRAELAKGSFGNLGIAINKGQIYQLDAEILALGKTLGEHQKATSSSLILKLQF